MSYTNIEQVRNHLISNAPMQDRIIDQEVILRDTAQRFHGSPIADGSLLVKSPRAPEHTRLAVSLGAEGSVFSGSPVLRGSVVAASDSSMGRVYQENTDYVVDYSAGRVTSKPGGALASGSTVIVWYLPYTVLIAGQDYHIDLEKSEIRRLSSGSIAAGEAVLLDFTPLYADITEPILIGAVAAANGLVEREVDPSGQYGADVTLGLAATYRALEIIGRTAAARELGSLRGKDQVAVAWMKLAEGYAERADRLLASFRPPCAAPANPVRS
jgi:hypothetical protein